MENNKKFSYIAGQILSIVVIGCIVGCICGLAIALTIKFLGLLF